MRRKFASTPLPRAGLKAIGWNACCRISYEDLMARRAKGTPLGRCATPEDVAEVIVNLITSNRFVNGEVIVVDGGYAATT